MTHPAPTLRSQGVGTLCSVTYCIEQRSGWALALVTPFYMTSVCSTVSANSEAEWPPHVICATKQALCPEQMEAQMGAILRTDWGITFSTNILGYELVNETWSTGTQRCGESMSERGRLMSLWPYKIRHQSTHQPILVRTTRSSGTHSVTKALP